VIDSNVYCHLAIKVSSVEMGLSAAILDKVLECVKAPCAKV
jgi:hypothetical protein